MFILILFCVSLQFPFRNSRRNAGFDNIFIETNPEKYRFVMQIVYKTKLISRDLCRFYVKAELLSTKKEKSVISKICHFQNTSKETK
jgi:hypothetical protein